MARVHYDVYQVDYTAAILHEQMGTKEKFWYREGSPFDAKTLFKAGRPNTGENWAEVISAQIATAIKLPSAEYQFAECRIQDKIVKGTITPTLIKESTSRMIHGNELLARYSETAKEATLYDPDTRKHHTLTRAIAYLSEDFLLPPIDCITSDARKDALDFFLGYLVFDALIGNQDRHAENWAIIRRADDIYHLCPTYDHGSSLGRNETDDSRLHKLTTRDKNGNIEAYCKRAASGFFPQSGTGKSIKLIECVEIAARIREHAFFEWQELIGQTVSDSLLQSIIDPIPQDIMSDISKRFTKEYIKHNLNRILLLDPR